MLLCGEQFVDGQGCLFVCLFVCLFGLSPGVLKIRLFVDAKTCLLSAWCAGVGAMEVETASGQVLGARSLWQAMAAANVYAEGTNCESKKGMVSFRAPRHVFCRCDTRRVVRSYACCGNPQRMCSANMTLRNWRWWRTLFGVVLIDHAHHVAFVEDAFSGCVVLLPPFLLPSLPL